VQSHHVVRPGRERQRHVAGRQPELQSARNTQDRPPLTASCDRSWSLCGSATLAAAGSVDSRTRPETGDLSAIRKQWVAPCAPRDLRALTRK
jgi:hypothetical protein